ncbi:MAG: hypothetical protein QOF68_756 [Gaiellales bacterium]|nr:hypothetical protein [Gaiellales bacterium]
MKPCPRAASTRERGMNLSTGKCAWNRSPSAWSSGPHVRQRPLALSGAQPPEEAGDVAAQLLRIRAERRPIRQRAEPAKPVRCAVPAHPSPRPPSRLSSRALGIGGRATHTPEVRRARCDEAAARLPGGSTQRQSPARRGDTRQPLGQRRRLRHRGLRQTRRTRKMPSASSRPRRIRGVSRCP